MFMLKDRPMLSGFLTGAALAVPLLAFLYVMEAPSPSLVGSMVRCTDGQGHELVNGFIRDYDVRVFGRWAVLEWSPAEDDCMTDRRRCIKTRLGGNFTCMMTRDPGPKAT